MHKKINFAAKVVLFLIKIYQTVLSPDHGIPHKIFPNLKVCIFEPTCSEYTYKAIEKYGLIKGGWLGIKRIARCGPWSYGANRYDPVP